MRNMPFALMIRIILLILLFIAVLLVPFISWVKRRAKRKQDGMVTMVNSPVRMISKPEEKGTNGVHITGFIRGPRRGHKAAARSYSTKTRKGNQWRQK